jgi:hypothetical protein
MNNRSLSEFVSKALEKNRISFGDVRRLQRNILPDGIGSREEAELLLALDGKAGRRDAAWTRWLLAAIVDFVVWSERPTGVVDEDAADWLASCLRDDRRSKDCARATLIAREIVEEAQAFENEALMTLAGLCRRPHRLRGSALMPRTAHAEDSAAALA